MLEIEGYAEYIEQEVLQRYYTCAAVLGHMAFPERELGRPGLPSLPTDSAAYRCLRKLEGGLGLTAIQGLDPYEFNHIIYHVGTQRYFERAKGDEIVPFHVDLEPALS